MSDKRVDESRVRPATTSLSGWIGLVAVFVLLAMVGGIAFTGYRASHSVLPYDYTLVRAGDGKPHFQSLKIPRERSMLVWERMEIYHTRYTGRWTNGFTDTGTEVRSPRSLFDGPVRYRHILIRAGQPVRADQAPLNAVVYVERSVGADLWLIALLPLLVAAVISMRRATRDCFWLLLTPLRRSRRGFEVLPRDEARQ